MMEFRDEIGQRRFFRIEDQLKTASNDVPSQLQQFLDDKDEDEHLFNHLIFLKDFLFLFLSLFIIFIYSRLQRKLKELRVVLTPPPPFYNSLLVL